MLKIKISPLDILVSKFVRLRAIKEAGGCEKCLAPKFDKQKENGEILPAYKQLQCSHFIKRRNKAVRYDEANCSGFCFGCHQYFEENHDEYEVWLKNKIGESEFNLLQARKRVTQKPDIQALTLYYKERTKLLEEV